MKEVKRLLAQLKHACIELGHEAPGLVSIEYLTAAHLADYALHSTHLSHATLEGYAEGFAEDADHMNHEATRSVTLGAWDRAAEMLERVAVARRAADIFDVLATILRQWEVEQ